MPYGGNTSGTDFWSGLLAGNAGGSPDTSFDWGGGFKELAKMLIPGLASAGVGLTAQALFPGQGSRIVGTDVRTDTGKAAEGIRLGAAGQAGQQLNDSFTSPYGALTPEEQDRIKRERRSADAARGMLETGGSGSRESTDLLRANEAKRQQLYGNVGTLTGGYQPYGTAPIPGSESPWSRILTMALAPAAEKGFKGLLDKWWA